MDCGKSWNMMMKKADGVAAVMDDIQLQNHINDCDICAERYQSLQSAFKALNAMNHEAPPNLENLIMSRIHATRQKEKAGLLPYVVYPCIILMVLFSLVLTQLFKAGAVPLVDQTARIASFIYKLVSSVTAVLQFFFKILYVKEILIVLTSVIIICFIACLLKLIKNDRISALYRRAME